MNAKTEKKFIAAVLLAIAASLLLTACGPKAPEQAGQIYLYGEYHAVRSNYEKEFELWSDCYHEQGMRHLFLELPYYTAEFLNLWMQSDSDDFLDMVYQDWEGTANSNVWYMDFCKNIKAECPETVFHGTDVGHQFWSTGPRYLEYLESMEQEDSEQYRLAQENIEQGRQFYGADDESPQVDWVYREEMMVENFIREMNALGEANVMGIYGQAHVNPEIKVDLIGDEPDMGTRLRETYGENLHIEMIEDLVER